MDFEELRASVDDFAGRPVSWLDGASLVTLGNGNDIYMELAEDGSDLYFYCHIASVPKEMLGAYALTLLEGNLFGCGTGGSAVLAYDPDECRIVLWDRLDLGSIAVAQFRERLCSLYLSRVYWSNKLRLDLLGGKDGDPEEVLSPLLGGRAR